MKFLKTNEKFGNKCYNKFCKRILQNLKNGEINMSNEIIDINEYKEILSSIKNEILKSQYRAMQVVNVEMIYMY